MDPIITTDVNPSNAFNEATFLDALRANGNVVEHTGVGGFFRGLGNDFLGQNGAEINFKETFENTDMDTILEAFKAGGDDEFDKIIDALGNDTEIKEALYGVLKDEGAEALKGLKEILSGAGSASPEEFTNLLDSPVQRKALLEMLKVVGTDKQDMGFATRFMQAGLDVARNPGDTDKMRELQELMVEGGIAPESLVDAQIFMTFFAEALTNPQGAVTNLMGELEGMGMSPEALEAMEKYLDFGANFIQAFGGDMKVFVDVHGPTVMNAVDQGRRDIETITEDLDRIKGPTPAVATP